MLSAKKHWIMLRLTALLNIPLVIWLVYSVVNLAGADYETFTAWLKNPLNAGLMILMIVSVFYHAMLGCHEIIEDYVHAEGVKKMTLAVKTLAFVALGAICVYSVVKVAF